ncbi:hypothetical protein LBMAG42_33840 [Deltaproteobacteria bacterium]|nr:hypothetical protein LBMAG42_33840 [Deltaproteobacteria bacterium]
MLLLLVFALGCAKGTEPGPEAPPPAADATAATAPAPEPVVLGALGEAGPGAELTLMGPADPAAADLACRQRVEGTSTDGECKSDADCARAGCSQEVCVSATVAPTLNTTCEKLPCFAELDTCGCVSGTCSWTWKKAQ